MSMTIIMLVCFFILILLSVPIGWALADLVGALYYFKFKNTLR